MSFKKLSVVLLSLAIVGGVLTGCGKNGGNPAGSGSSVSSATPKSEKPLPPLDMERIAADEARGIRFSADKRTLEWYNGDLPDKEYAIPSGVTIIGEGAFMDCESLTSVTIPSSVTTIGEWAFYQCSNLTSVTIPAGVTTIGERAFEWCRKVEVSPENPNFYIDASGALIYRGNRRLIYFPPRFSGAYAIPSGVTTIGNGAFSGCKSLTSVTIPPSVTTIGERAFFQCSNLTSVTIPQSVTTIGMGAFSWCHKLTRVTIPASVTTIGNGAFLWCRNLTSVTIRPGVKTIGECAFFLCSNLTSVTIPASVTTICYGAFEDCERLTSVTIPAGVTTIGEGAFRNCPCEKSVKKQFPNYR